jgi:hypothetical protein
MVSMSKSIDYLFAIREPDELNALFEFMKAINSLLAKKQANTDGLVSVLRAYQNKTEGSPLYLGQVARQLRSTILNAVIAMLEDDNAVYELMDRLQDYDSRFLAASFLGWFGPGGRPAVQQLIDIASGASAAVEAAKQSLLLIGNTEHEIMLALQASLDADDDGAFRELCDLAVRANCENSDDFFAAFRVAIDSNNSHVREVVVDTIKELPTEAKKRMLPFLKRLAQDADSNVRRSAIDALH